MEHINGFKAAVAAVVGCLTALWGWFGWLVVAWVVCMLLDYGTGTAAALRAGETTAIVNAARLRLKESDRLASVTQVLNALGAGVEEHADHLVLRGRERLAGGVTVSGHNDHRIAMMLAVAATRAEGTVTIRGAESVAKSYPDFWEVYESLGGRVLRQREEREACDM